jgi:hypothetical protein
MKGLLAAMLVAGALVLVVGTTAAVAGSSTVNQTVHCDASDPGCQFNPIIVGPPPVAVPSNCPAFLSTDAWSLAFLSGNGIQHFTSNNNGGWGTGTGEGPAALTTSTGTVEYTGHATVWFGGGNNSGGQSEGGFTLTFNGSGTAGTISIHADQHSTTNNGGAPTSNVFNATITCS